MKTFEQIIQVEDVIVPIYNKIKTDKNPIFLWGTGALARNVISYCKNYDIKLEGCFVDTEIKKSEFENYTVYSYEELCEKYDSISVIIGHAEYAAGNELLKSNTIIKKIYCMPNICYRRWEPVSKDFVIKNDQILTYIYENLSDDISKACMCSYFESRINDDASYMFSDYFVNTTYFKNDIYEITNQEVLIDVGACYGQSILSFIDATNGKYKKIIAIEPNEDNFVKLQKMVDDVGLRDIICEKVAIYNQDGILKLCGDEEQCIIGEGTGNYYDVTACKLDSLAKKIDIIKESTLIKINTAGVPEMLEGAEQVIKNSKPKLIIRLGFEEESLIDICKKVKEINPEYQVYFRYTIGIPMGLTLFAM